MSKTKFEISLEYFGTAELSDLISNEEVTGRRALQVRRELNLREKIVTNTSKPFKKIPKRTWIPKLFGWELRDFKWLKVVLSITFIGLFINTYRNVFFTSKPDNYSHYDTVKSALLIDFKTKTVWVQDFNGGSETIVNYKVSYKYKVAGRNYYNSIILQSIPENHQFARLLRPLITGKDSIDIRYNSFMPSLSTLNFRD